MKYTIKELAELAGVSTRTLRYYDEIDLLKPDEINKSNYRIYTVKSVDKLQQIMFYRSLELPLSEIKRLMDDPNFSRLQALKKQQQLLLAKQKAITDLLTNIDQTIKNYGENTMPDKAKFAAFKKAQLTDNETKYGKEIRQKYGDATIEKSNQKYQNLTETDFQAMKDWEQKLINNLVELKRQPDLDSSLAKEVYQDHKEWLSYTLPKYNFQMHRGLVDMYLADNRFAKYYDDKAETEVVKLLHDVVYHYTK